MKNALIFVFSAVGFYGSLWLVLALGTAAGF